MKGDKAKINSKKYLYEMIIHVDSPSAQRRVYQHAKHIFFHN